jgi:hypothetical protein
MKNVIFGIMTMGGWVGFLIELLFKKHIKKIV